MRLSQTFHPQQGCWLNAATSDPSQLDEAEELIPTNPKIIINNKSLLFQSTGFWSSLLYNNRYGKYHFITLGISGKKKKYNREPRFTQSLEGQNEPLLDCGVWGYRELLTVQISGRFHLPLKPQSWWLKTGFLSCLYTLMSLQLSAQPPQWLEDGSHHCCLRDLSQWHLTSTPPIRLRILDSRDLEKCRFQLSNLRGWKEHGMMREVWYPWPQPSDSEFSQNDTEMT